MNKPFINNKSINLLIVNKEEYTMYNVNQIPELEAKIAAAIAADGSDETPGVTSLVADIASPSTGLIYTPGKDGAPGKLRVASGWMPTVTGDILKLEDVSGPNGQYLIKDGVLVPR